MLDLSAEFFESDKGRRLYSKIASSVEKYGMDRMLSGGVLLGFSGGADSVLLLHFLRCYLKNKPSKILCVHINHLIRGEEAFADEEFSRSTCEALGVEFLSKRIDVPSVAAKLGLGLEECARNIRYNEFNEIIRGRNDISAIAVAHNSTDNVETVLLNVLRGAGARGASGIPPVRDNICRPLISASKSEIVEALSSYGIKFVTDSTNLSSDYTRNYVRNEVLPKLRRISNDPEAMFLRMSENLRSDDDYINSVADEIIASGSVTTDKLASLHESVFVRVVARMVGDRSSISSASLRDLRGLLGLKNFRYSLPGGAKFIAEGGVCRIQADDLRDIDYICYVEKDFARLDAINSVFAILDVESKKSYSNIYKKSIQANLRSAIINGRLYLRPKKDGDTVYYGGMTHKLKKLFNDKKIPPSLRSRIPVLCDDSGVVWVPGFGVRDDRPVAPKDIFAVIASACVDLRDTFLSGDDFKL